MKALAEIRDTASKFIEKRFNQLTAARDTQNAIGSYATTDLDEQWKAATAAFYDSPSVETFKKLVRAKQEKEIALRCWQDVAGSIGLHTVNELTTGDDMRADLERALTAYAEELSGRITQIENDTRELCDRSGIDYAEPAHLATLRAEFQKARDGISACRDLANDAGMVWRTFSPIVRPIQRTAK